MFLGPNGDLRLVDNPGRTGGSSGRLEVYYNGQWGTVCQGNFGVNDAMQCGLSSTRVLNLHSIRNSWNARVSVYYIGSSLSTTYTDLTSDHIFYCIQFVHSSNSSLCNIWNNHPFHRFSQPTSSTTRTWVDELLCRGTRRADSLSVLLTLSELKIASILKILP